MSKIISDWNKKAREDIGSYYGHIEDLKIFYALQGIKITTSDAVKLIKKEKTKDDKWNPTQKN